MPNNGLVTNHQQASFANPQAGQAGTASVVLGNDNATVTSYNAHDADPTIHLQNSILASRPAASAAQIGPWLTAETASTNVRLFYSNGSAWQELNNFGAGVTFATNISINGIIAGLDLMGDTGSTVFGASSLISTTVSGLQNTGLGYFSLNALTTGNANVAVGYRAMYLSTTGQKSVAVGWQALGGVFVGNDAVAIGYAALGSATSGVQNTAVGYSAAQLLTTGAHNTAVGFEAMQNATTANDSVAVGYQALGAATYVGAKNVIVGYQAGALVTSGGSNSGLGYSVLGALTTGSNNAFLGQSAGAALTVGAVNTGAGLNALNNLVTGSNNVALGAYAGAYETASNAFYINNQDRTNTAGDKASSLFYGTFNATASSQTLVVNATVTLTYNVAFSAVANLSDGAVATPSLSFSADTDTGFSRAAANLLSVAAGAQEIMRWSTASAIVLAGKQFQLGTTATAAVAVSSTHEIAVVDAAGVTYQLLAHT